ncbi:uncharacterized protein LOC103064026 [Python bivittatus]|uniref:Uncharacterized protein LOC103064026 n=1 Tax=Python bivittatus TaxID=176946 RepID=A0A9F2REJ1_PYTBI|nr:uncharacterized protein LOC103064026 [Python bivittatus]
MDSLPAVGPGSLPSSPETDLPLPLKKFYRGEPLALGITQIFTGIIGIVFGLLVNLIDGYMIDYTMIKMPYWSGILYIISGSLAVAAARKPKLPLVSSPLETSEGHGLIRNHPSLGSWPESLPSSRKIEKAAHPTPWGATTHWVANHELGGFLMLSDRYHQMEHPDDCGFCLRASPLQIPGLNSLFESSRSFVGLFMPVFGKEVLCLHL